MVRLIVLSLHRVPPGNKQKNRGDYHDKEKEINHGCVNLPFQEKDHEKEGKDDGGAFCCECKN